MLEAELPLETVGARLLRARESAGLSRAHMANVTKIPERHLAAIEASNFSALPARTYAVGFSRSYAKALGLDEREVVDAVRAELAQHHPAPVRAAPAFEPGDPARVPAARFAGLAALAALLVIVAGIAFAWRSYYAPAGTLPSILPEETAAPPASASAAPVAPTANGPVVFTALAPAVWVKFTDGSGKQIMQKEMAQGETFTVPQDLAEVKIWTAHPEALAITVGGQPVAKLAETQQTVKDVPVTAAALLARTAASASQSPGPSSTTVPPVATNAEARNRASPSQPRRITQRVAERTTVPAGVTPSSAPAAAAAPAPAVTPSPAAT